MNSIKPISKLELNVLKEYGFISEKKNEDVAITSKRKGASGKQYFVKDTLAFVAWDLLDLNPDDKDFQRWKSGREQKAWKK